MALSDKDLQAIATVVAQTVVAALAATPTPKVTISEPVKPVAATRTVVHGGHEVIQKQATCGHWVNAQRTVAICKNCLVASYRSR